MPNVRGQRKEGRREGGREGKDVIDKELFSFFSLSCVSSSFLEYGDKKGSATIVVVILCPKRNKLT